MNENIEISQIDKEIDEKLSDEFEKNKKIIDWLNQFEIIVEKDFSYIRSLVIKKIISVLFEACPFLINENSLEELALMIFELLFLLNGNLYYNQLDEKVSIFQIILNILANNPEQKKEKIFMNEVLTEKIIRKNLVNEIKESYGDIGFFLCLYQVFKK